MRTSKGKGLDFKVKVIEIFEDCVDEGYVNIVKDNLIEIIKDIAEKRIYEILEEQDEYYDDGDDW